MSHFNFDYSFTPGFLRKAHSGMSNIGELLGPAQKLTEAQHAAMQDHFELGLQLARVFGPKFDFQGWMKDKERELGIKPDTRTVDEILNDLFSDGDKS